MSLANGVTAIVVRRTGEKDMDLASHSALQSILLGVFAYIPFALAGIFYAKDLLQIMGGDAWPLIEGFKYTQWMLGVNLVIMLLFIINAIYRGAGDAAIAMRVLWVDNGTNILYVIRDPLLIFGWGLYLPWALRVQPSIPL
mgnify:CR=1 FL=1